MTSTTEPSPEHAAPAAEPTRSRRRSATAIDYAERQARAILLRRQGVDYRNIARVLGVSTGTAHTLVQKGLERLPLEAAQELRGLALARLDEIYRIHADLISDPRSAAVMIRAVEVAAKLAGIYSEAPAATAVAQIVVDGRVLSPPTRPSPDAIETVDADP